MAGTTNAAADAWLAASSDSGWPPPGDVLAMAASNAATAYGSTNSGWPSFTDLQALHALRHQLDLDATSSGTRMDISQLDVEMDQADSSANFFQSVMYAPDFFPAEKRTLSLHAALQPVAEDRSLQPEADSSANFFQSVMYAPDFVPAEKRTLSLRAALQPVAEDLCLQQVAESSLRLRGASELDFHDQFEAQHALESCLLLATQFKNMVELNLAQTLQIKHSSLTSLPI